MAQKDDIHAERIKNLSEKLDDHVGGCVKSLLHTEQINGIKEILNDHENRIEETEKCLLQSRIYAEAKRTERKAIWALLLFITSIGTGAVTAIYWLVQFCVSHYDAIVTFFSSINSPK